MEWFHSRLDDDALPLQFDNAVAPGFSATVPAMKLRALGEDRLLARLLPSLPIHPGVIAGAGDDCAIVDGPKKGNLLVLKTDCLVEKIHFKSSADPALVGWKAIMRPLSDFAAASGLPQFALVTLIVPATKSLSWVEKLYRGMRRAASRFRVSIVGGETSNSTGPATISVSVSGFVEKKRFVTRRGGKPGDALFVSGRLGGALSGKHLRFMPRIEESRWLTANFRVHAMMDLSDGLGADLPRLAKASKVDFKIDVEKLPLASGATIAGAISDGEDYELLFAIPSRQSKTLQRAWRRQFPRLLLTRIGDLVPLSEFRNPKLSGGYVHFQ
jgi:thiamine-monophosphate kinase